MTLNVSPADLQGAATGIEAEAAVLHIQVDGVPVPAVHPCVFAANTVSESVYGFMEALRARLTQQGQALRTAAQNYTETDAHGGTQIEGATWL